MKKIFKFSLFALFLGFASCDDAIDIVQANELDEEGAYQSVEDLQTGLNGVYASYVPDAGSNGTGDLILFNELFTDGIKRGMDSSGQGNQEYSFTLQPGTQFANTLWSNRYALINYANRLLRAWDRIFPTLESEADIERANQIKAQTLALRGMAHFELLQYFTPEYQNPNSPSVIIMDFVPEITDTFPRNTAGEVFEFINNDLEEAANLIGDFYLRETVTNYEAYYINERVIKAFQARVALCQGNYALAGTYVDAVGADDYYTLSTPPNEVVNPTDPGTYQRMYTEDLTTNENIWTLARKDGDNGVVALFYANGAGIDGSPFFELSYDLFEFYDLDGDGNTDLTDVRLRVLLEGTSEVDNGILLIGKYQGGAFGQNINDIKIVRWAEMLLIRAEVQARAGQLTDAANTLRDLRQSRIVITSPPVNPTIISFDTTNEALRYILDERRRELAFEGHRYIDLKRLGAELGIGIDRDTRDCASFSAPCGLPAGDFRFTLPIPRNEINANPGIEQNPGY
ncbi:RagB/SusD family nutrient uptake outer membrane protein [Flavobacterium litorale]|uniref:RagB/SusD family nutrient uptake outer membrane protein n=1 Tax=Flavobacterium litorale TaxID=2856519 RepID=A0ABX8V6J5_9FLAO|nr:RagB/SusD family nutrient uptake outer membrane protein [Flavobacterium litorale]QYJ68460.1 RagB/SusD family nutrient uptake outer membrane protein [Flavobacterium litorale]